MERLAHIQDRGNAHGGSSWMHVHSTEKIPLYLSGNRNGSAFPPLLILVLGPLRAHSMQGNMQINFKSLLVCFIFFVYIISGESNVFVNSGVDLQGKLWICPFCFTRFA